jgi:hypothetical protein
VTPSRCSGNSDAASYRRVVSTQGEQQLSETPVEHCLTLATAAR